MIEQAAKIAADLETRYRALREAMTNLFNAAEAAAALRKELSNKRKELIAANGGETFKSWGSNDTIRNGKLDELTAELRAKVDEAETDERFLKHQHAIALENVEETRAILRSYELAVGTWRGQR